MHCRPGESGPGRADQAGAKGASPRYGGDGRRRLRLGPGGCQGNQGFAVGLYHWPRGRGGGEGTAGRSSVVWGDP